MSDILYRAGVVVDGHLLLRAHSNGNRSIRMLDPISLEAPYSNWGLTGVNGEMLPPDIEAPYNQTLRRSTCNAWKDVRDFVILGRVAYGDRWLLMLMKLSDAPFTWHDLNANKCDMKLKYASEPRKIWRRSKRPTPNVLSTHYSYWRED